MTKAELVDRTVEQIGPQITKRDAARVVDAFLEAVKEAVAEGNHIEIRGFGTFKTRQRNPRPARNPRTGEEVQVDARSVLVFKVSKELRAMVEQGPSAG